VPSLSNVLLCAVTAALFWSLLGWSLARWLIPERALGLAAAPALGWAIYSAASLPVFLLTGFTLRSVAMLSGVALLAGIAACLAPRAPAPSRRDDMPPIPWWCFALAALLAVAPTLAILPKFTGDGVILAEPIFDHAKAAMVDGFARAGLPAGNPFFADAATPSRLGYYYLWHFSAAVPVLLWRISGWEADIALTWFTAFASLALMMGLAVRLGRRSGAALWVILLSLAGSLRPLLGFVLGAEASDRLLKPWGLQSWLLQASWVPQHLASATCAILAALLVAQLAGEGTPLAVPALALLLAAGFESSSWIGGVAVAASALPIAGALFLSLPPPRRLPFLANGLVAIALALALAFPMIRDQYFATAAREAGIPIAFRPYEVLGTFLPHGIRRLLDLPAYWLIFLIVELPALYLAGGFVLVRALVARGGEPRDRLAILAFAGLAFVCLAITWLFVSTIGNNDLGWRAVLPAILLLTVFAAAGLARWLATSAYLAASAAILLFLLGLPDGLKFIRLAAWGTPSASAANFAASPALWESVRRHSAPEDRVGNNPLALADLLPWPVNISWALLADRPSCFAGRELVLAYGALPKAKTDALEAFFARIFAGDGSPEDVQALAQLYGCRLILLTASDGAWRRDEFASSPAYRKVEEKPGAWRIYRATELPSRALKPARP
jgi:hypothetical protein